jgi:hypothetical protein
MRPILFGIDDQAVPPQMTICFPGQPNRFVTIPIGNAGTTRKEAEIAAVHRLDGLTPIELEVLRDHALPGQA